MDKVVGNAVPRGSAGDDVNDKSGDDCTSDHRGQSKRESSSGERHGKGRVRDANYANTSDARLEYLAAGERDVAVSEFDRLLRSE